MDQALSVDLLTPLTKLTPAGCGMLTVSSCNDHHDEEAGGDAKVGDNLR